jgi:hypothetical protein
MAIAALGFLAADHKRLEKFLSVTGLGPQNLRGAAADPGFYGSVLDYLLADEPLLLAFAAEAGLKPEGVARAHQALIGPRASEGS